MCMSSDTNFTSPRLHSRQDNCPTFRLSRSLGAAHTPPSSLDLLIHAGSIRKTLILSDINFRAHTISVATPRSLHFSLVRPLLHHRHCMGIRSLLVLGSTC